MPFTKEHIARIASAVKTNNLVELDAVMLTQVIKPSNLTENDLCLKVACRYSQTEVIKRYLAERTFSEDILYLALYEAVQTLNRDIILLLIEKYTLDQNRFFDSELCNANEIADLHIACDKENQTSAFHLSITYSDKDIGMELFRYFIRLNNTNNSADSKSKNLTTGLHVAASAGKLDAVKILIEHGAEYNAKNEAGLTPFELAHRNNYLKVSGHLFDVKLQNTQVKNIPDDELIRFEDQNLGEGTSAWVYKGTYSNQTVAIKVLKNSSTIERAKLEIKYIMAFESPYIVKAHGMCLQKKEFALVLHYYPNGSLGKILFKLEIDMPWNVRERIIKDVAYGLDYAHACLVIHGDLKPDNILLQLIDGELRAVITDFDTLKQKGQSATSNKTMTIVNSGGMSGTRGYFAPQLIDPRKFNLTEHKTTSESDVYSFGILTYTIAKREMPFPKASLHEYEAMILKGKIPEMSSKEFSLEVINVVQGCMKLDPSQRLIMRQVIKILDPEIVPVPALTSSDRRPLALVTSNIQKLKDIGGSKIGGFFAGKVSPRPQTPPGGGKSAVTLTPRPVTPVANNVPVPAIQSSTPTKLVTPRTAPNTNPSPTMSRSSDSSENISNEAKEHEMEKFLFGTVDIEKIKIIYDTGGITFNCKCSLCTNLEKNAFHDLLRSKLEARIALVKYIIDHPKYPVDINLTNRKKRTILHIIAVSSCDGKNEPFNNLKCLFNNYGNKYFININAQDKDGNTPLHLAGARGNTQIVAELLNRGADSSIKNYEGLTPYDYAARECKNAEKRAIVLTAMPRVANAVTSSLVNRNAAVNSTNGINNTRPVQQVDARDHAFRRILVDANIDELKAIYDLGKITFNCNCSECLSTAENVLQDVLSYEWKKEVELAKYMLDHPTLPVDINIVNRDKRTFLHLVAKLVFDAKNKPHEQLKNFFLNYANKYFIDINAKDKDGNTPLHLAAANGNVEIVRELLNRYADCSITNNEGLGPSEFAARECKDPIKKSAILSVLPKAIAPLSSDNGAQVLSIGQLEVATVDARDHEFRDLLNNYAINFDVAQINKAKALYDAGKITFKCNCTKCTAADKNVLQHILCFRLKEFVELAKYMIAHPKYPVNINIVNKDKRTIVHLIAQSKFDAKNEPLNKLKNLFLYYGDKFLIDVNAKDKDGNTPLHLAAAMGNVDFVTELLNRKADFSIKNSEGLAPYEYAERECQDQQKKSVILSSLPKINIADSLPLSPPANSTPENNNPCDVRKKSATAWNLGVISTRPAVPLLPVATHVQRERVNTNKVGSLYISPPASDVQLQKSRLTTGKSDEETELVEKKPRPSIISS